MTDNLRGALFMTLAMLGFAIEDALIKTLGGRFSPGQIIWMLGLGGVVCLVAWLALRRQPLITADTFDKGALLRTACEVAGTVMFVQALVVIPLSTASVMIQATPLLVALGASVFLGMPVGWRRWIAILVGFFGVLIIVRPGTASYDPGVLLALGGVVGLAARDLVTRRVKPSLSGVRLSLLAFVALIPAGAVLQALQRDPLVGLSNVDAVTLATCVCLGMLAYISIVTATRTGDISVVSSFRYTRLLFALVIAGIAFGERPDLLTYVGAAIILGAGLFTLWREARTRGVSPTASPG